MKILLYIKKCFSFLENYKKKFVIVIIMRLISMALSLFVTFCLSRIIALISTGNIHLFDSYIIFLICAYILSLMIQYIAFHMTQKIEKNTRTRLKKMILGNMLTMYPQNYIQGNTINSAKANEILYSDVNNVTTMLFSSCRFMISVLTVIITGFLLFFIEPMLALILTVFFIFTAIFVSKYSYKLKQINIELREKNDEHFKITRDILKNIKYIYLNDSCQFHHKRYSENIELVKSKTIERDNKSWLLGFASTFFEYFWIVIFLVFSVNQLKNETLNVSNFMLFFSYSRIYSSGITGLLNQYAGLQQITVSIDRVLELINVYKYENEKYQIFPEKLYKIRIENVIFGYKSNEIFLRINTEVKDKSVLITGKNGIGKTTFLNLLIGILEPTKGKILYNDIPINSIEWNSLKKSISYAPQGDLIFDISIRDNILSFDDDHKITETQLKDMCDKVGILEDILKLENKFDTSVDEIRDFSFGQKKKMLLARACLRPSQIILFDEPLEGLDAQSQQKIVDLIKSLSQEKFVFIATHKPGQFSFCQETIQLGS